MPLPVAMRLELERELRSDADERSKGESEGGRWLVRVAKERHGRVGMPIAIAG
jgi:hypothetical protein